MTAGYTEPWAPAAIGAGTANLVLGETEHPGAANFRANASANTGYAFQISGATTYSLTNNYTTSATLKPLCLGRNNFTYIKFGFMDTFAMAAPADGVFINITQFNLTHFNVSGMSWSGSAKNKTPTTYFLANNTWVQASIYINSSSLATFYLYNSTGSLLWTDTTPSVPTGIGKETSHALVAYTPYKSTGAQMLLVDYMSIGIDRKLIR